LAEDGQAYESEVVSGVENARDADQGEVRTTKFPKTTFPANIEASAKTISAVRRRESDRSIRAHSATSERSENSEYRHVFWRYHVPADER
jgi:hypothetical protein